MQSQMHVSEKENSKWKNALAQFDIMTFNFRIPFLVYYAHLLLFLERA